MDPLSSEDDEPTSPKNDITLWFALALAALIAGGIIAYWMLSHKPTTSTQPATSTTQDNPVKPRVRLSLFAAGLPNPTGIAATGAPGDTRLFVLDRDGVIRIVTADGTVNSTPFLDIKDKVLSKDEMGLLGMTFSPHYTHDGYFFINYIDKAQETIIARYQVSGDPDKADPASSQVVLKLKQPYPNHNGGALLFGKDGYLYASLGDGGSGGDPENRAQNLNSLFGKILRLDVNSLPYKIPPTNPFVNQAGKAPEIWDYGLRNPWRISFDTKTHDLYIADVGQGKMEEVNVEPGGSKGGNNYGWRCYEGTLDYNLNGCQAKSQYIFPVATYEHTDGRCSVTGGYAYRGHKYPALDGTYFYGDYCTGELFMLKKQNSTWQTTTALKAPYNITTFGQDNAGELYLADFLTGAIYQITDASN